MNSTIRIAGAQIPIKDNDIQFNKNEILNALDWAKENAVDCLLTPEGSLSGYGSSWWMSNLEELEGSLLEVEKHQKKVGVELHLGTSLQNREHIGFVNRNHIRHYGKDGNLYGLSNKTYIVPGDGGCVSSTAGELSPLYPFDMPNVTKKDGQPYQIVGMVCNDMWGSSKDTHKDHNPDMSLNEMLVEREVDLVFHATNNYKFPPQQIVDSPYMKETFDMWHESHLRMTGWGACSTILTVDGCTPWEWDGDENEYNTYESGSQSGVITGLGERVVGVPRTGRQYFHYDLEINAREKNILKHNDYNRKASELKNDAKSRIITN